MRREFKLPDVGEGLTEAEIVRWHVKPGDQVRLNQTIVEIETAKAVVELPCPFEGVVTALMAEEGQSVDVGTPIIAVDDGAAEAEPSRATPVEDTVPKPPAEGAVEPGVHGGPAPKQERQPVLVGYGVKTGATKRRPRRAPAPPPGGHGPGRGAVPVQAPPPAAQVPAPAPAPRTAVRVVTLAKPPVRKLAKDLGVDLTTVKGTGPGGTITRDDVHAAASAPAAAPRVSAAPGAREERVPIKGVRRATAQAMVASAFTAPHVTEFLTVDVTRGMRALKRLRKLPGWEEVRVTPLLLVAKAVLLALRRHPMINSTWQEATGEIVVKEYVNLGIAAATERGLIVPNIKDAGRLTTRELAEAITDLVRTAKAGKTTPADMTGGTFTITNVGIFGVDTGTPILPPGEAAILAVGAIREQPWVHKGKVVPRQVTTLGLSFDHRIIDGELGSKFLADVGAIISDPAAALLGWS